MKRFLITFVLSFIGFYLIELCLNKFFGIDMDNLNLGWLGWLGLMIVYGFKYHILCCLLPLLYTSYVCSHKKCKHEHCEK